MTLHYLYICILFIDLTGNAVYKLVIVCSSQFENLHLESVPCWTKIWNINKIC